RGHRGQPGPDRPPHAEPPPPRRGLTGSHPPTGGYPWPSAGGGSSSSDQVGSGSGSGPGVAAVGSSGRGALKCIPHSGPIDISSSSAALRTSESPHSGVREE